MDGARRGFLLGRRPAAHAEGERLVIGDACLARAELQAMVSGADAAGVAAALQG